jgi:cytochrome c6
MDIDGGLAKALRWLVGIVLAGILLLAVLWPPAAWGTEANAQTEASGAALFTNHCAGCHSNGGNVIRRGKTLRLKALERNGIDGPVAIRAIAAGGIGQMGGYGEVLGEGGDQVVAEWVWEQALADWPKG